jgi:hypothetical protein
MTWLRVDDENQKSQHSSFVMPGAAGVICHEEE